MKKIPVFILLMFFTLLKLNAQSGVSAVAEVHYNTYSHNSLSDLQQQLSREIDGVYLRVNDDFGANMAYSIGVKVEDINTQYFFSYNSTGGKVSYSDYTGVIRVTQLLQAYTFGGEYQFKLSKDTDNKSFYLGARAFGNYTTLGVESYSQVADYLSTETIDFDSMDFGLGVRFIYDIPVYVVKLRLNAGYDFMLGGELILSEDRDYALEDNTGDRVKTGWSGLRSGIGIVVPF